MASQRPRTAAGPGSDPAFGREGPRYAVAIPAIAQTQHAISRAVAQLATTGLLPAASIASLRSWSLRLHFAAWRLTAGEACCPGASGFGARDDIGTCQAASVTANLRFAV